MTVRLSAKAAMQLENIANPIHNRITQILERLENWPKVSGVKTLTGNLKGCYRVRTGDYRVQFYVEGDKVVIEKIGHRDGFYDEN